MYILSIVEPVIGKHLSGQGLGVRNGVVVTHVRLEYISVRNMVAAILHVCLLLF